MVTGMPLQPMNRGWFRKIRYIPQHLIADRTNFNRDLFSFTRSIRYGCFFNSQSMSNPLTFQNNGIHNVCVVCSIAFHRRENNRVKKYRNVSLLPFNLKKCRYAGFQIRQWIFFPTRSNPAIQRGYCLRRRSASCMEWISPESPVCFILVKMKTQLKVRCCFTYLIKWIFIRSYSSIRTFSLLIKTTGPPRKDLNSRSCTFSFAITDNSCVFHAEYTFS